MALATSALALAGPASAADPDKGVPNPLANGSHSVQKIEYDAGSVLLTHPSTGEAISAPMNGSIWYPDDTTDPGRIVVFVHGRHSACIGTPPTGTYFCDDTSGPDGTPTSTNIRSYGGYDYMGRNLATHGYVVMSIEANLTNFDNLWRYPDSRFPSIPNCVGGGWCDGGAGARSQVIEASLQLLYRWNNGMGPVVAGDPAHSVGTKLVGKVDFANGIGMMGHSRGGDAVTDYIGYNRNKTGGARKWALDGVLALAPVNYTRYKSPAGTNYGLLLPACDGDVSTLQGGRFFENAKYPTLAADNFAKVQWYVQGTDHNFFNTVWTEDDFSPASDPACSRAAASTARLTPTDQRRVGQALMNGFMRRYVGGEKAFEPLMTGEVTLPSTAAPLTSGKGADQEVKTSYVGPASKRIDVLQPAPLIDDGNPYAAGSPQDTASTAVSAQGGPILVSKELTKFAVCRPPDVAFRQGPTLETPYPRCPMETGSTTNTNRSIGTQFTVDWEKPATVTATLGRDGATKDVSGLGALDLRAAVNRWDVRNPAGDSTNPTSATQDFDVTLVDAAGNRATTNAARWSTALQPSIGTTFRHVVLNGIRIPLSAFVGVDLTKVAAVELGFGKRTPTGSIQLADVAFQETAPAATTDPDGEPDPDTDVEPEGPPSTPPGPVIGTPQQVTITNVYPTTVTASATSSTCADLKAPSVTLAGLRVRDGRIRLSGAAADAGCAAAQPGTTAAGGVKRTFVSIYRRAGDACRYVSAGGRLLAPSDCDTPVGLYAKGTTSWTLSVAAAKLPKGRYAVRVTTFDKTGNLKRLPLRWVTVR